MMSSNSWCNPTLLAMMEGGEVEEDCALKYMNENSDTLRLQIKSLAENGFESMAVSLMKWCLRTEQFKTDVAMISNFLYMLHKLGRSEDFHRQCCQLMCCTAKHVVRTMQESKYQSAILHLASEIFLLQDLLNPRQYCCTEELLLSWLSVQKDENQGNDVILENVNKMVGVVENVQHLTIFLRALYNKFGTVFLPLCTDLALRVLKLQCHLSGSDEFMGSKESVSLAQAIEVVGLLYQNFTPLYTECLLSCLHLDPSKERYRMVEEFFIGKLNDSVGSNCKTLPVGIETYNSVLQSINALRPVVLDRKLSWAVLKKLIIDNFAKCGYIFDPVSNSFVCVKPENTGMDLTNGCGIKMESGENVGTPVAQTTRADAGIVKDSSSISTKKRSCTRIRSCNLRINHDEKNGSYTVQKINAGRRKSVSKMENCATEDVEKYDSVISDIKDESRLNNNKKTACRKLSKQLGAQYIDDDEANNLGVKTRPRGSEKDEKMKSVTASIKGSTPRKRSIRGKEDATSSGSKKCKAVEIPRITRRSSIALEGMASKSEKSDDGEMCRFCRRLVRTRNQRLWHEKAMCQKRGKKSPEKWNRRSAWKGKSIGRGMSMKWSPEKRLVRFARCIKSRMALSRLKFPNGLQLTNCFVKLARIAVDPSPIVAEGVEVADVKPTLAGAVLDEFCDTNELSDANELRDTKLVIDDMDSMLGDSGHNNFANKDAKIEVKEDSDDVQSFAPCVCDGCGEVVPDCSWLTAHIVTCIGRPGSGNNDSEMDEFASEGPSWVESVRTNGIENESTGQLPGHELFTNLTIDSSNANASFDHNPNQADVGPAQMLQMLQKGVENPVVFDQSVAAKNAENNAVQTINSSTYSVSSQITVPECAVERSGKEIMFNDVSMYEFVEFQCSGCLLTFFNDTSLCKHIQSSDHRCATITKLSVFCCVKCGVHYLDKHIMWHHAVYLCRSRPILEAPNELYKCLFCTKAFLSELFLQRHVWLKHNNETVTVNHLQKAGHPSVQEFGSNPETPAAGWNSFQKKEIKACDASTENGHKTTEHSGGCNPMDSSKSNDPQALLDLACSIVLGGGGCSTSEPLESADANKPSPQKQLPSPTTPAAAGPTRRTAKGIMYKNVFMQCIVNYLCSSCKKDLSTKASKKEHKQSACFNSDSKRFTYLRQYSYLCPYCSEKFPSQKACRQHQLTVCLVLMGVKTDELNYKQLLCPFCDKKYFNIITLKGHMTLIHKVNKFESSQLLDGTGTFTEMLGQGSDGANSSRNDDTDSIAEPIETKLPDVIDEAKKLKKKRKPKKKAAIVAIDANSVAEKPVLENSLSDESISPSGINKIEPVSDVPISTSAAIATENMDCVEVSMNCKEFKNRIIMNAENSALLVKFESSSSSEYRMDCIKTENMSDSNDPKILCVPDLEPKVGKLEPTSDEEKPACGNVEPACGIVEPTYGIVEPTCGNVKPTCDKVEPTCGNVEPTCGNVKPTCDKVEPICGKVEPICDNVEPICGNVEPSFGHLDPLCIDSKPALDSSEQILHHPEPTCDNAIAFDDIKLSSQKSTFECLSETVELTSEVMEALLGGPEVEERTESDERKLVIRKRPKKVRKKVNAKTKKKSQY